MLIGQYMNDILLSDHIYSGLLKMAQTICHSTANTLNVDSILICRAEMNLLRSEVNLQRLERH